jgi:hypothetical protein
MDQLKEKQAMTEAEQKEIEEDSLYKNDALYKWRALRLMSRGDIKSFDKLSGGGDMDDILAALDKAEDPPAEEAAAEVKDEGK